MLSSRRNGDRTGASDRSGPAKAGRPPLRRRRSKVPSPLPRYNCNCVERPPPATVVVARTHLQPVSKSGWTGTRRNGYLRRWTMPGLTGHSTGMNVRSHAVGLAEARFGTPTPLRYSLVSKHIWLHRSHIVNILSLLTPRAGCRSRTRHSICD